MTNAWRAHALIGDRDVMSLGLGLHVTVELKAKQLEVI